MKNLMLLLSLWFICSGYAKADQASSYQVNIIVNPANAGIAAGAGIYQQGSAATIQATAFAGFTFNGWSLDGVLLSLDPNFSLMVTSDLTLKANFVINGTTHSVATHVVPFHSGYITAASAGGNTFTLQAHAYAGFQFSHWEENGVTLSTDSIYTVTVSADHTFNAHFNLFSSMEDPGNIKFASVFPNPNNGVCTLELTSDAHLQILNAGSVLSSDAFYSRGTHRLQFPAAGLYFLRLTDKSGNMQYQKIVVQ